MITWLEIVLRLLLACFLGAMVGLERERKDWTAGLRTHMMVCLGSSLIMIVSAFGFADVLGTPNVSLDPSRIAAQVVSGIGFIGAGTIMFLQKRIVRGLTTAAGLWTVAAVGLAVGGGMYLAAIFATVFAIVILWIIQPIERKFSGRFKQKYVEIVLENRDKSSHIIDKIVESPLLDLDSLTFDKADNEYVISFQFKSIEKNELAKFINDLQMDDNIKSISWNG